MGPDVLLGILIGLLVASVAANIALYVTRHRSAATWRQRARGAEDEARAAQLRSAEQIDALLDRVSTSPRIEFRPPAIPKIDPDEPKYIPETEDGDAAWNAFRGEPDKAAIHADEDLT